MDVSITTANNFLVGNCQKYVCITIYDTEHGTTLYYDTDDFLNDSLMLKQAIQDNDFRDYSGCISSYFEISVMHPISDDYVGCKVVLQIGDSVENAWNMFTGYIDRIERSSKSVIGKQHTKITAYDKFKQVNTNNCAAYIHGARSKLKNKLTNVTNVFFPGTTYDFTLLPSADTYLFFSENYYDFIGVGDFVKSISQVNASSAYIDPEGGLAFHVYCYDEQAEATNYIFPAYTTLPGQIYPYVNLLEGAVRYIQNYKSLTINSIGQDRISHITALRNKNGNQILYSGSTGEGDNGTTYRLENNLCVDHIHLPSTSRIESFLNTMMTTANADTREKFNYELVTVGLPYIFPGDWITVQMVEYDESNGYVTRKVPLLVGARTLKGIQNMEDVFSFRATQKTKKRILDGGSGNAIKHEEETE